MNLFLLCILCFSIIGSYIATLYREKLKGLSFANAISFIVKTIVCLYFLLVGSFFIFYVLGLRSVNEIQIGNGFLLTVEDIPILAIIFLAQWAICCTVAVALRVCSAGKDRSAAYTLTHSQFRIIVAISTTSLLLLIGSVLLQNYVESRLLINEICSKNVSVIANDNGQYGDYIELYNPTKFNIRLSNYYVTDDLEKGPLLVSEDAIIPAGGYFLVWTETEEQGFGIRSEGGETIYLLNYDSEIIDSVIIPSLCEDTVYARDNSETGWSIYYPSPLKENNETEIRMVEAPEFSDEGGFYADGFTLKLNAADGCNIYYTLDSSVPDENSLLYTDGIEVMNVSDQSNVYRAVQNVVKDWNEYTPTDTVVDKAFIVRAVAIDEYGNRSDVVTKTYFVDMEKYQGKYVLSLVSDPEDLFGEKGIYVTGSAYDEWYTGGQEGDEPKTNFSGHGAEYEIETSIELYYNDLLMSQMAGMRIQGASNRDNALKRFMIYSRKQYSGSRYFEYDLFDTSTHSFLLRSDFADAFLQSLVPDRGLGGMEAIKVSVFLDGEFWYNTYIRQKYSEDYLAGKYQLNRENITFTSTMPEEIYSYLEEHDLSDDDDYYGFDEIIDIQNYIDYMTYNIYLCNMDLSETKNLRMWKSDGYSGLNDYDDGRWRFLIYDMDSINWNSSEYYGIESYGIDSFSFDHKYAGVAFDQETIFSALKVNVNFCRQFVLTFMDFANTYFCKDVVEEKISEWGYDLTWDNSFFEKRFDYIVPYLAEEFNLTGSLEEITICTNDLSGGSISINTVTPELSDGVWSGYYYTDYPVTITANENPGYEFVAWHHGDEVYTDNELIVNLNTDNNIWEAEFKIK